MNRENYVKVPFLGQEAAERHADRQGGTAIHEGGMEWCVIIEESKADNAFGTIPITDEDWDKFLNQ